MHSFQPMTRRASLARVVTVAVVTALVTLYYSLCVLTLAACGRLRRSRVDRYTREWSGLLLRLVRMRLSVHGELPDFSDGRRYMILCNHSSHYDIPATFVAMPGSIRMLAKQELYGIPILGRAMRAAEFPSIDRHSGQRARADLQRAREMMESGIVLWAAPEGTRSADGQLLPFKRGCFRLALDTEAVIVPIAIRGIQRVLPARTFDLTLGQPVDLVVGQPMDAAAYRERGIEALLGDARERMQALLEQPLGGEPGVVRAARQTVTLD
ncbi:lysophospholipid acyltransferase family protein [Pseudomonas panipatensis]|jgi:1-acyl-sn-glycerol-3-phosphate acyltransferase|uniref:1-acyl-sn-glycerol-3-phosphate acyltransferase n=1 Tax=Pseudomonas panipatensis TaxID=428992 RepID=A0A1G8GGM2_9PSED|nr:lysophospholipid acyltransferase family protein [Pseudomonas panipatensis]SDH93515.1 1-acyl-sn-glycerol-3-phosphate acyltransferase [Pseudomonas panipatensis]SMP43399.1 1-acyl-sn-glycerol-3-phosphate acyltransferase [Pseudomonas panipatensis]